MTVKPSGMPDHSPTRPRLLLILPTSIYQADAYVDAASRLDIDLTVASELPSSLETLQPDKLITLDLDDDERAAAQAAEFAERYPISAVVGVNDKTSVTAAHIADELGLDHLSLRSARLAASKNLQRETLHAAGVMVPEFSLHHVSDPEILSSIPFPRIVKPASLSASRGVIRANDQGEFGAAVQRLAAIIKATTSASGAAGGNFLIESYIPGVEFALEGIVVNGKLHTLAIFDKPDLLEGPFFAETIYVTPSRHDLETLDQLEKCAAAAVSALKIDRGPVHIELRFNDDGAWIVELAARPIGGKCGRVLEFENGETLEGLVVRHAMGLGHDVPRLRAGASGVMMLPVVKKGVLQEIVGADAARAVANVTDVLITAHPGQKLVPLPEGSKYLGFIFARARKPEAVEESLRRADKTLDFILKD